MTVYKIDPLRDPRWAEFLHRHPHASVFHTPGWLEALRRTYGYQPVILTTSPERAQLRNGLAFCRIHSWLTGRRIVSLPFAEHCEPLVESPQDLEYLLSPLGRDLRKQGWRYIEIRPVPVTEMEKKNPSPCPMDSVLGGQSCKRYEDGKYANSGQVLCAAGFKNSESFIFHRIDLHPATEKLFRSFHVNSIQQKIKRAQREGLTYEEGRRQPLLDKFYYLFLLMRKQKGLPPAPLNWFRNLVGCLGEGLQIRVASKDGRPVGSILTLTYKQTMVYEYGCSDPSFNNLGGMPFLLWKAVQEAKDRGLLKFELGRADFDNLGLITFKDRLGASRSTLAYWRYPPHSCRPIRAGWKMGIAKQVFARTPHGLLTRVGELLYKHIG